MLYVASPNDQFHDVGVLVDESVNVTIRVALPVVGVPVKFATGAVPLPPSAYTELSSLPKNTVPFSTHGLDRIPVLTVA